MAVLFLFFGKSLINLLLCLLQYLKSVWAAALLHSVSFCVICLWFFSYFFFLSLGAERKKRTQTLELLRGVWCSLKHQFIDQRSSQFDLLFFLLFPFLFCHFSLVCGHDTTSCLYRATCSFEHTATYWQRGILPLKSHKEEPFRWSQISFGFIPEG